MSAKYGPKGTRILFENDQVRVWEIELAPGQTLPMHHHDLVGGVGAERDQVLGGRDGDHGAPTHPMRPHRRLRGQSDHLHEPPRSHGQRA